MSLSCKKLESMCNKLASLLPFTLLFVGSILFDVWWLPLAPWYPLLFLYFGNYDRQNWMAMSLRAFVVTNFFFLYQFALLGPVLWYFELPLQLFAINILMMQVILVSRRRPDLQISGVFLAYWHLMFETPVRWLTRLFHACGYRLWLPFVTPVSERVWMGSMPFDTDVQQLTDAHHRVVGVVNMCGEYGGPAREYRAAGVRQLRLPTTDCCPPTAADIQRGVDFIHSCLHDDAHTIAGDAADSEVGRRRRLQHLSTGRVYIHCRAGRGRAAVMTLCYLVSKEGWSVEKCLAHLRAMRPVVSRQIARYPSIKQFIRSHAGGGGGGDDDEDDDDDIDDDDDDDDEESERLIKQAATSASKSSSRTRGSSRSKKQSSNSRKSSRKLPSSRSKSSSKSSSSSRSKKASSTKKSVK
jgi:atypical dual specificity phosphatase